MARKARGGAPGAGAPRVAALVAETGSVAAAARELGVGRGTLDGILAGVHGAGQKVLSALRGLRPARRVEIRETERRLSAGGRAPREIVQLAKQEARTERRAPGTTRATSTTHRDRMAAVGLTIEGELLGERDALGRRITPQQRLYQEIQDAIDSGLVANTFDDAYEYQTALELSSGGGGTGEDIEPMFRD